MWRLLLLLTLVLAACGGPSEEEQARRELERRFAQDPQPLPGDAATEQPVEPRSVTAFVRDYQRFGFFAGGSAERAAQRIERAYQEEWGEQPKVATRYDELELLAYDRKRVWFSDIELDVLEGNDVYVSTFAEWARIARGAFEPRNVHERWRGEEGPVTISFELDGSTQTIEAAPQGDFLDLCVLEGINRVIDDRRFEAYRADGGLGQVAFVVALTPREKRALEEHGWAFATPAQLRETFGYGQVAEEGAPTGC